MVDDEDMREVLAMSRGTSGMSYIGGGFTMTMLVLLEEESDVPGLSQLIDSVEGRAVMITEAGPGAMTLRASVR